MDRRDGKLDDPDMTLRTVSAIFRDKNRELTVEQQVELLRRTFDGLDAHLAAGGTLPARWGRARPCCYRHYGRHTLECPNYEQAVVPTTS